MADSPNTPNLDDARRVGAAIERRLGQLRDRIRRRFLVHGLGWILAALLGGVIIYFALDRLLDLPSFVRVVVSIGLATFLTLGVRRRVLYPMSREISGDDVALAVEHRFPELHQRLISAVQLARDSDAGLRGQSEAMVARVVDEAADEVQAIPTDEILDPRRTVRVWAVAGVVVLISVLTLFRDSAVSSVFFARMFGSSASYPRATTLFVELPTDDPSIDVSIDDGEATIVMPAGGDLPVLVRVEGTIPREVSLVQTGGRGLSGEVGMTSRGGNRFRHVYRRVQDSFSFHARGGDDPYGDLRVSVETIEPPRVASIQAQLTFPAYTGIEPTELVGGSVEAVIGTQARLSVTATAAVKTATLRLLDAGTSLELTPVTIQDDAGAGFAYVGEFTIERSDRYQIDFVGPNGIGNPHPGTYPIVAVEDRPPVAQLVTPSHEDFNVVLPNGLIPLRIAASDDYGVETVIVTTEAGQNQQQRTFDLFTREGDAPRTEVITSRMVEVSSLSDDATAVGDTVVLGGQIRDNREPENSVAELTKRHVHVVDASDLSRRISSHFRRIRESVEKALSLQTDRRSRLQAIQAELEDGAGRSTLDDRLIAVEVGQGRVLSTSRRVHRELMRSFDVHLFNRLEESLHAPKVVQLYVDYHTQNPTNEAVVGAFYRDLAKQRELGTLGAMEKTLDPILRMIGGADRVSNELGAAAVREIESAGVATSEQEFSKSLARAEKVQESIVTELEALRAKLDEWNEFQDVIQQTRTIRDKQKDLRNRTRSIQGDRK